MERNFTEFVTRHGALINELSAFPTEKSFSATLRMFLPEAVLLLFSFPSVRADSRAASAPPLTPVHDDRDDYRLRGLIDCFG